MPSTSSLVTSSVQRVTHDLAVFQMTKNPVSQIEDIVDIMADEEDSDALSFQFLDEVATCAVSCGPRAAVAHP